MIDGSKGYLIYKSDKNISWEHVRQQDYPEVEEINGKTYGTTKYFAEIWGIEWQSAYAYFKSKALETYRIFRQQGRKKVRILEINDITKEFMPERKKKYLKCPNGLLVKNDCLGQIMALGDTVYESAIDIPEYKFITSNKHRKSD